LSGETVNSNSLAIQVNPGAVLPPVISSIANAASDDPNQPLAPGTIFRLTGKNLGTAESDPSYVFPLPKSLGGARVTICGADSPLLYNSGPLNGQWQIIGVVPNIAAPPSCDVVVSVESRVKLEARSQVKISLDPNETAALFSMDVLQNGTPAKLPILMDRDWRLIASPDISVSGLLTSPAHPGEPVIGFGTGCGRTTPPVPDGEAAPSNPLAWSETAPTIQIYSVDADVLFSGLAPGLAGLCQINVVVPPVATSGEQWFWFGRPNVGKFYHIWVQ